MTPSRLVDALPPAARAIFSEASGRLDPADSFVAAATGLTTPQALSRARNSRRSLGQSWPDSCEIYSIDDPTALTLADCSFFGSDPALICEAAETVEAALGAPDAGARLARAALADIDSRALARVAGVGRRRAQQLLAARRAAVKAGQGVLL